MNRNFSLIWIIVIVAGITVAVNQTWQIHRLFQETKREYIHIYRNILEDALAELSMLTKAEGNAVGYDADTHTLTFYINGMRVKREVAMDVSTQWIKSGPMYDVRDTTLWTLEALNEKVQERFFNWCGRDSLPLKLVQKDSAGSEITRFQQGTFQGLSICHFTEDLGFLSKDTLEVTCDFTLTDFWAKVQNQVFLIVALLVTLVFCIIAFVRMFWREKRASAFRELFVQAFVHDLKLPISNALKCEYLLGKSLASGVTSENERWLTQIDNQLMRVQGTIGMLLTALTDEHGVTIQPEEVNIHKLLEELASSRRWHVTAGRIFRITTDLQVRNPYIEGDEVLLEAVLQNLIENALKYSEGDVNISICSREVGKESIQIVVTDDGWGIPRKALKKIFKPRYRIPEYRERVKGTGIGLSVAKSIVEAHGGTVRVESEQGRGSRFMITLPYKIAKGWQIKWICYMRRMMRMQRN